MISKRNILNLLFPLILSLAPFCQAQAFQWKRIPHEDINYISLEGVKKFYGFTSLKTADSKIILSNKSLKLVFQANGKEVLMNEVKIILNHPTKLIEEEWHIPEMGLTKFIDPILRPNFIPGARPFDTIIIDPGFNKTKELDNHYNLKVAKLLQSRLIQLGFKVVLTRTSAKEIADDQRVTIANRYKNAIFINLQFDSIDPEGEIPNKGIQTLPVSPKLSASIALATATHWGVIRNLQKHAKFSLPDQGIRDSPKNHFPELKHPAVLIKIGYLNNPIETKMIQRPLFQSTVANALADSVIFYRKATTRKKEKD